MNFTFRRTTSTFVSTSSTHLYRHSTICNLNSNHQTQFQWWKQLRSQWISTSDFQCAKHEATPWWDATTFRNGPIMTHLWLRRERWILCRPQIYKQHMMFAMLFPYTRVYKPHTYNRDQWLEARRHHNYIYCWK